MTHILEKLMQKRKTLETRTKCVGSGRQEKYSVYRCEMINPDGLEAHNEIVRLTELSEMLAKQLWEQVSRNLKLVEYWKKQQKEKERLEIELFNLKQKLDRLTLGEGAGDEQ